MEESICIFGASSTQGFFDTEKGGWVDRLKIFLFDEVLNSDNYYQVFNLGIDGNNSRDLVARFSSEISSRKPTIVIISIGDNDSAFGISIEEFGQNISKMIGEAKKYTNKILLLGRSKVNEIVTNPVSWGDNLCYLNAKIKLYDEKLEEVAGENGIFYLKMIDLLDNEDLEDGLHPNSKGHKKIFDRVKDYLSELEWI